VLPLLPQDGSFGPGPVTRPLRRQRSSTRPNADLNLSAMSASLHIGDQTHNYLDI
jgi:hypothetical protein